MKTLPCETCRRGAETKSGNPYIIGSFSSPELIIKCWRCKRSTLVTRHMWNRLPEATHEEVSKVFPGLTVGN